MITITFERLADLAKQWTDGFRADSYRADREGRGLDAQFSRARATAIEEFAAAVIQTGQTKRAGGSGRL